MTAAPSRPTACLALADGTIFYGKGFGATGDVADHHGSRCAGDAFHVVVLGDPIAVIAGFLTVLGQGPRVVQRLSCVTAFADG